MARIIPNQKFRHDVETFEKDNTYEVDDALAEYFVRVGWASSPDLEVSPDEPGEVTLEVDKAEHGQTASDV
jgi:hypothetical protein